MRGFGGALGAGFMGWTTERGLSARAVWAVGAAWAGHAAAGLRLVPENARSTIARVDIWADQSSGLPLAVKVYAAPAGAVPVLSTELVALTAETLALAELAATHDVATFTHVAYMSRIDPESAAEAYIRLIGRAELSQRVGAGRALTTPSARPRVRRRRWR